jgi:hypothetical protein
MLQAIVKRVVIQMIM